MYKVECYSWEDGERRHVTTFTADDKEDLDALMRREILSDASMADVYEYEVFAKTEWQRVPYSVSVDFTF